MLSQVAFTILVALVAIQRLAELALSRRNEAGLRARGAIEHAPWQYVMLAAIHSGWLVSMVAEVWLLRPECHPWVTLVAMLVFVLGQVLRLTAMRTLGDRWSVRVLTVPGTRRVSSGLYSRLPHPNYLGVALEIAFLPLVHGAVLTCVLFTGLNAAAMVLRINTESRALAKAES